MKKMAVMVMAAFMMSATVPALAAEMTKEEKDMCLLASKNCATEVDTLQKKIKKLNAEIKKGKKVYSAEDLKKLDQKLEEANKMLDQILTGTGGGN
uniref:Periplasmic protein n=1 Tax=Geobacter metallireducens TaxID=28232 RepID=A0A831UAI1_GEOME